MCPIDWHVPTDQEWDILRNYLDPSASTNNNIAGGKMKEAGLAHWLTPNTGATNESGFAGLPGGNRNYPGNFFNTHNSGGWWSSTETPLINGFTESAWSRNLNYLSEKVFRIQSIKGVGLSVRCLRD